MNRMLMMFGLDCDDNYILEWDHIKIIIEKKRLAELFATAKHS